MAQKLLVFETFISQNKLAETLAERIASLLVNGIRQHGRASLVVSGGKTPLALFRHLSGIDIAWQQVDITLADERWVDTDDPASNEHLVRTSLLQTRAAHAHFIGLKTAAGTALQGMEECNERLTGIPMPFDVIVLGMGSDGHTASLFPGAENLQNALDLTSGAICAPLTPPDASHQRMTLTLPALLTSRHIFLHITGEKKRRVYEKALRDGPPEAMPIRFFLRQQTVPVTICWAP